jgi:hypothetical protein
VYWSLKVCPEDDVDWVAAGEMDSVSGASDDPQAAKNNTNRPIHHGIRIFLI